MSLHAPPSLPPPVLPVPAAETRGRWRLRVAANASLLPGATLFALWVLLARLEGGFLPRVWYPAAIGVCALLAAVAVAGHRRPPLSRPLRFALGLLTGLVALSYLSMLWAGSPGSAWETSNQLLLLAAGAWVMALTPWTARSGALLLGLWAVGVAVVCATFLVEALGAADLTPWFSAYRWAEPTGYPNGAAAMATLAFWPALVLSSRIEVPAIARALLLPVAVFLLLFSLLAQSRASVLGLVVMAPVLLALAPQRLRLLARAAVAGGAVLLSIGPISRVYTAVIARQGLGENRQVMPVLEEAARAIGLAVGVALVAGVLLVLLDRRLTPGPSTPAQLRRVGRFALPGAAIAGAVAAFAFAPAIGGEVRDRWETLESDVPSDLPTGERFSASIPDARVDYWRVSLGLLRERPVAGVGAGNFERQYTALREKPKLSRYPHDVWLRFAGENGALGLALFVGFVLVTILSPLAAWRRLDAPARGIVAACVAMTGYFLVHASFDWLDRIPAVAGPALAVPLIALRMVADPGTGRRPRPARPTTVLAGLAGLLIVLAVLGAPYLAVRWEERAQATWRSDPARAFGDFERAADANPLSLAPRMAHGTAALWLGHTKESRAAFRDALSIEDHWYPRLQLALLDAQAGQFGAARREIARAKSLNPLDRFIGEAARRIAARQRIDPVAFSRELLNATTPSLPRIR